MVDPHTSGTEKLGIQVCSFKGDNFLCEDAALFKLPLSYSVVVSGSESALVYRLKTSEALEIWPPECQNELKVKCLDKYLYFYERILQVESVLSAKPYRGGDSIAIRPNTVAASNAHAIEAAKKVERHTQNIYPQATQKLMNVFKNK